MNQARSLRLFYLLCFGILLPASVSAFGPHEKLQCADCHAVHVGENQVRFAKAQDKDSFNPKVNHILTIAASSCTVCHKTEVFKKKGGLGPVCAIHVKVWDTFPESGAGKPNLNHSSQKRRKIGCDRCHDPHQGNSNYKYLIVNTANGKNMRDLCVTCHSKTDRIIEKPKYRHLLLSLAAVADAGKSAKK